MKKQKGFSVIEVSIILVVLGLIGGVGWYVWQSRQEGTENTPSQTTQSTQKGDIKKSTPYKFGELGITMDILDGWKVTTNHTDKDYTWDIEKPGADGAIKLESSDFHGGFDSCSQNNDVLTPATVYDINPTSRSNLLFMSWSYRYQNETVNRTGIVRGDGETFQTTNDINAKPIRNQDVQTGNYYFCLTGPDPGFSLGLSGKQPSGTTLKDRIGAYESSSSLGLQTDSHSYGDVKTMLTSIR